MESVKHSILAARPKLRVVSPLAYWIVLILGVFNILLGVSLFFEFDAVRFTTPLLIVNEIFSYQFWGGIFTFLGVVKLYSLAANKWALARNSLIAGVLIKATWAVALIIRTIISPGTLFMGFVWVALALIQMATYVFFMPPSIQPGLWRSEGEVTRDV